MAVTGSAPQRTSVPFLDLGAVHRDLKDELLRDIAALVDDGAFVNGPAVAVFEDAFARYCGTTNCVGTGSGLDALRLALQAAAVEPGDEVIVPAQTFVATLEAVTQAGAVPVPVDISADDWNIDPSAVEASTSVRTRFVMPVHLYGQMADMRRILRIAARHELAVIEDACQAHGATRDGIGAGTAGLAGGFSFYPGKNLGAMGDAGAVVTSDGSLAARVRAFREHGQTRKYHHEWEGWTSRLDTMQAMVLRLKLRDLDRWNRERAAVAAAYTEALSGVGDLELPHVAPGSRHVWHLYVVCTADPTALGAFLTDRGIESGRHYPEPVHLSPAYRRLGYRRGRFPVAERLAARCLSLPIFPGMSETDVEQVVGAVTAFFDHHA
jgi:dTDP-4-amino-4,6-dideoxygalactose transaminase